MEQHSAGFEEECARAFFSIRENREICHCAQLVAMH
jgi:hypothetical protein